eukprot:gene1023-12712_t
MASSAYINADGGGGGDAAELAERKGPGFHLRPMVGVADDEECQAESEPADEAQHSSDMLYDEKEAEGVEYRSISMQVEPGQ